MRMKVDYKWGHGSYGSRLFDIDDDASPLAIELAALQAVPKGVSAIISVKPNDGRELVPA
jgi:hypothetical protein